MKLALVVTCVLIAVYCVWEAQVTAERPGCVEPPEVGYCKARLLRWFYNSTSHHCNHFYYGGCGGNQNNYETEGDCQAACMSV